jgi:TIR domain
MTDFFISYTHTDQSWAEWIGYVVEENGFTVVIQAWDFRPGSNFVVEMQNAATEAERTIMVVSPDYIKSRFTSPEWAAAFADDPQGLKQKLVPVVVQPCELPGLLRPLVHIDLVGVDESRASAVLMSGLKQGRAKPLKRPSFPGPTAKHAPKSFPGAKPSDPEIRSSAYKPKLRRAATDFDKLEFMREAFAAIRSYFQAALEEIGQDNDAVEYNYAPHTDSEFIAEIFVNGSSTCRCRIWQGGMLSNDGISYAEGRHYSDTSCNESLVLSEDRGELHLTSLMGIGFGRLDLSFDLKRMSQEQAAEYLWRRFVAPLER